MKIAIVHDFLAEFGGADRVLQVLVKMFPSAHVYTAYANVAYVKNYFPNLTSSRLHTSWAQNTFLSSHKSLFQCLSPFIWRSLNLETYDIVISHPAHLLCNIISVKKPIHIQYIPTPPKNLFALQPKTPLQYVVPYSPFIASEYKRALRSTPYVIANSHHMKAILYKIARIRSTVLYPPVNIPINIKRSTLKYFICVSRIDVCKSLELPVLACTQLQMPLKIVGRSNNPRYEKYLKSIAGPTVEFLGMQSDSDIQQLYESAIGFIFSSQNEDFGIAPIEAMAHGVPVISYYGGALKETMINGKTGIFYYQHTVDSLVRTLRAFNPNLYSAGKLHQHAKQYSKEKFIERIRTYITGLTHLNNIMADLTT